MPLGGSGSGVSPGSGPRSGARVVRNLAPKGSSPGSERTWVLSLRPCSQLLRSIAIVSLGRFGRFRSQVARFRSIPGGIISGRFELKLVHVRRPNWGHPGRRNDTHSVTPFVQRSAHKCGSPGWGWAKHRPIGMARWRRAYCSGFGACRNARIRTPGGGATQARSDVQLWRSTPRSAGSLCRNDVDRRSVPIKIASNTRHSNRTKARGGGHGECLDRDPLETTDPVRALCIAVHWPTRACAKQGRGRSLRAMARRCLPPAFATLRSGGPQACLKDWP